MYNNIGGKLKVLAIVCCIIGIIGSVIMGFISFSSSAITGLLIMVIGSLLSWISSLATYGLGEVIENSEAILRRTSDLEKKISTSDAKKSTVNRESTFNPNIPKSNMHDFNIDNIHRNDWTCSCGAKNSGTAKECSVCFKSRPTQKQ